MLLHPNLCDHADNEGQLYKIWDDDLKNARRHKEYAEGFAILFFVGSYFMWRIGGYAYEYVYMSFIVVGIILVFAALKFLVDESNINYLMHQWDLQVALDRFRRG